jgi:hypothetical protein
MPNILSKVNNHERDTHIVFDEEPHIYYINGKCDNISVTTFVHKYLFPKFDSDKIIDNMMKSKRWKYNKYFGMTKQEIINLWDKNGRDSALMGTNMHKSIEDFYNGILIDNDSIEFKYFLDFNENKRNLIPYRTEWVVYDSDTKFCGSIDMLYKINEDDDTNLIIYDWKRCKKIIKDNKFEKGFPPVSHLPNCNYWHYSLQLNIYKRILEKNYGKKIKELYLLDLHPDNETYIEIKVPIMTEEMDNIFLMKELSKDTKSLI